MDPVRLPAGAFVLRSHGHADIEGVLEQCLDPESQAWTTVPVPYTRADAESFVLEIVPSGWQDETFLAWAIADAESDQFLGTIDIRPKDAGRAEIGFGLHPKGRGRGAASAAVRAVAEWAFSAAGLGLGVIHWHAAVGNWASRRVAWATGFRLEGTIRGFGAARGVRQDTWVGSLTATDLRQARHPWFDVPTLRGQRCLLRRFTADDEDAVYEGCTDPETRHWLGALPNPYTRKDARSYIASREEEPAGGRGIYWAAADPDTGTFLGSFGLMGISEADGHAEVGYWVHPAARGRGVATDAVRLLIRHASIAVEDGGLGLRRLTLRAAAGNLASQRVAQKAGFAASGRVRSAERLGTGAFDDCLTFDLLLH